MITAVRTGLLLYFDKDHRRKFFIRGWSIFQAVTPSSAVERIQEDAVFHLNMS